MSDDSYLEVTADNHISSYVGKDATLYFQARMLYMGLKARKNGIQLARNYTPKRMFQTVKRFTGKDYKITDYDAAMEDLNKWMVTMETALPIVKREEKV